MKQGLIRFAVALWFMGMAGLAIIGNPLRGEAGDTPKLYFPLMTADAPGQLDPDFRNYVGLGISDADGDLEIYTVRGDSSELTQLTQNEVTDRYPSFSPNGARVAFTREILIEGSEELRYQVVVVNRDGSEERVLWEYQMARGSFVSRWSPRGQHLLVVAEIQPSPKAWVIGLDGSALELVGTLKDLYAAEWSPDGRYVNHRAGGEGATHLYVTNIATEVPIIIGENVVSALWAPDSRDLLVVSYSNNTESAIFVQPDGSGERVAFNGGYTAHNWVRNGTDIVVESVGETDQNFYLIPRAGGDPVPLTTHTDSRVYGYMDPTNAGMLYAQSQTGSPTNIYWIPFDTRTPRFIAQKGAEEGLSSPALSQNRTRLLYSLTYCENRSCGTATYFFHLDDPTATPQLTPRNVNRYLPNSSNRAAYQSSGDPDYDLSTIEMVQMEPPVVTRVNFTEAVKVRTMAEWRYLP